MAIYGRRGFGNLGIEGIEILADRERELELWSTQFDLEERLDGMLRRYEREPTPQLLKRTESLSDRISRTRGRRRYLRESRWGDRMQMRDFVQALDDLTPEAVDVLTRNRVTSFADVERLTRDDSWMNSEAGRRIYRLRCAWEDALRAVSPDLRAAFVNPRLPWATPS